MQKSRQISSSGARVSRSPVYSIESLNLSHEKNLQWPSLVHEDHITSRRLPSPSNHPPHLPQPRPGRRREGKACRNDLDWPGPGQGGPAGSKTEPEMGRTRRDPNSQSRVPREPPNRSGRSGKVDRPVRDRPAIFTMFLHENVHSMSYLYRNSLGMS